MTIRLSLDENDFRKLVSGGVATFDIVQSNSLTEVRLVLQDIGFNKLFTIMNQERFNHLEGLKEDMADDTT